MFAWIFRTFLAQNGGCEGKMRKGWCDVDPYRTRSYFLEFLPLCHLAKIDQEMRF